MLPPVYDASVIESRAFSLYAQAQWLITKHAIIGALIGAPLGFLVAFFANRMGLGLPFIPPGWATVIGAIILGSSGASEGRAKGSRLRFDPQMALWHIRVESALDRIDQKGRDVVRDSLTGVG